ncbi:MAG: hypothetical protein AAF468_21885 [Pseudomonadota bacterium]
MSESMAMIMVGIIFSTAVITLVAGLTSLTWAVRAFRAKERSDFGYSSILAAACLAVNCAQWLVLFGIFGA